jgi:hypothetical protein
MDAFSDDIDALAPPQDGFANSEMIEDVNYVGWMQDVDGDGQITLNPSGEVMYYQQQGLSTVPSIAVDEFGEIYILYASTTETYEVDNYNYKHIWLRHTTGGVWGDFTDLTNSIVHIFDECYYPVIGKVANGAMHYIYNADVSPGLAWSDDHAWQDNRTIYGRYDVPVGIDEIQQANELSVSLSPNPASNRVMITLDMESAGDVHARISNISGQLVKEVKQASNAPGTVSFGIDISDLPSGTYICTVMAGQKSAANKLIVR